MTEIRTAPCSACPYRCDVPSGVWAAEEYDKLRLFDAPTPFQPARGFMCHATPDHFCHGWAVVHEAHSGHELLALRFAGAPPIPEPTVPLFSSGCEAANHGQRDVNEPTDAAREVAARLVRKYERLR